MGKHGLVTETHRDSASVIIKKGKKSGIAGYVSLFDDCKHDAYISHGEVLCGRATHDMKWADDILSIMKQEFSYYLVHKKQFSVFEILCDGAIVGLAVLEASQKTKTAQIHDFMIKKNCQGKGIGTEALHIIEQYLRKANIGMLLLESGIQNKGAHDFFEKNGFTQISVEFSKKL